MKNTALGIIDAQRGFMPVGEGQLTPQYGYGELAVPDGDKIIEPVNRLLGAFAARKAAIFTTQDWHPPVTAHFSETPDFQTNWPVHCVDGTMGAQIDPRIKVPGINHRFVKGFEALERGEDDTSYSAYYAEDPITGHSLPEWLESRGITSVVLGGLALDYCVGKSAIDLRTKANVDVTVALDATRGIADESINQMLAAFEEHGIRTATTDEILTYAAA